MAWTPECSLYTLCFSLDCVGIFPRKMTRWDTWGRETKINLTLLFQIGWIAKTLWLGQTTWQGISNSIVSTKTLSFQFREREVASNVGVWKSIRLASVLVFVNQFRFNGWCLGHHRLPKPESCVEVFMLTLRFGGSSNPTTYLSLGKKRTFLLWYKCVCICNSTILWMSPLVNE